MSIMKQFKLFQQSMVNTSSLHRLARTTTVYAEHNQMTAAQHSIARTAQCAASVAPAVRTECIGNCMNPWTTSMAASMAMLTLRAWPEDAL